MKRDFRECKVNPVSKVTPACPANLGHPVKKDLTDRKASREQKENEVCLADKARKVKLAYLDFLGIRAQLGIKAIRDSEERPDRKAKRENA